MPEQIGTERRRRVAQGATQDALLSLRLLGPTEVAIDGQPVRFARRKALALLAYLAVARRPHAREALATLIAGDVADEQAAKQLRNALNDLRDHVGDWLTISRQTVAFDTTRPHWLDVDAFRDGLAAARAEGDPSALEEAVGLYRGEFLEGLVVRDAPDIDDWLTAERDRLRAQFVAALQEIAEGYARHGDLTAGIAAGRRLLAVEPWREEAHQLLMRLFARAGQRQAALAQYETCRRVLRAELGVEPEAETAALAARLAAEPTPVEHNLPALTAPFVGRGAELDHIAARLADPDCRLLTVVGLGGMGKSALALAAAWRAAAPAPTGEEHPFADGVYLAPLAGLRPPPPDEPGAPAATASLLAGAIGRALGLAFQGPGDPTRQLAAFLRPRKLLLVLDNLEHLLAGVGLLGDLLRQAPRLTLLTTSRERLQLQDEWTLELRGLPTPMGPDDLEAAEAGRLFLQAAGRAQAGIGLEAAERAAAARICQLTDGLPLALVLAASWRRALTCAEIAAELESGLDLLTATARDAPARQRSVRVVLGAAWARLADDERPVARRLAAFRGSFDRAAARAVAGATPRHLLALRDRELVEHDGRGRYRLHELVRQYAAERLGEHTEEADETRARHAAHYAAVVAQQATALYQTRQAREVIGAELDDIRAAWEWAMLRVRGDLLERMREGLAAWSEQAGLLPEWEAAFGAAAARLRAASAAATPDSALQTQLGWLLATHGRLLFGCGELERALLALEEASALARAVGSAELEAASELWRGQVFNHQGQVRAAQGYLEHGLRLARAAGARHLEGLLLAQLTWVASLMGDESRAQACADQALVILREVGDRLSPATVHFGLFLLAAERGVTARAWADAERIEAIADAFGSRQMQWLVKERWGVIHSFALGQHRIADAYFEEALRLAEENGDRYGATSAHALLARSALFQGDLERSRRENSETRRLAEETGSRRLTMHALFGLATLAHLNGDNTTARALAQQAVAITESTGRSRYQFQAVLTLGHAQAALGDLAAAEDAYQQALAHSRHVGNPARAAEATAGLARVALARNDLSRAVALVEPLLAGLLAEPPHDMEEPARLLLTCAQALQAVDDPRAAAVLTAGRRFLEERAAQFADDERRRRLYLTGVPAHRALAHLTGLLADPPPAPADATEDAATGRPPAAAALALAAAGAGCFDEPACTRGNGSVHHH
jgi:DNA-binding SARP family transcriptional activator/predicted ATPase